MWNIIAASKITQAQIRQKNYDLHQEKLRKIRGSIHIKEPYQPHFIFTKPKLELSKRERLTQIDHQNGILLSKMDRINQAKVIELKVYGPKSLNQHVATLVKERIDNENRKLCNRLMKINSHYPTGRIISESTKLSRISVNISENARRCKSFSRLSLTRPSSAILSYSSKFVRSKSQKQNKQDQCLQRKFKPWNRPGSAPSTRVNRQHADPDTIQQFKETIEEGSQQIII